ncbi:hypothetical protein D3C84_891500 [compost metagenome]
MIVETVPHQQTLIRSTTQCAAEGIGRDDSPLLLATQASLLLLGKGAGHAGIGEDRKQAPLQEAELRRKGVIAEYQLVSDHGALRVSQHYGIAVLDLGNRAVLEE